MPAAPDLRAMMKRSRRLVGEPHDVSHKLDFKTLRPAQVNDLLRASEWRYSRRLVTLLSQWSTAHYTAFTPAEAGYFTNRLLTCPVPWEAGIRFADRYADLTRTWRFSRIKEQTQYSEVVDLVCGVSRLLIKHGRLPSALLFAAYLCAYMQKRRTVERLAGPPLVRLFALLTEFEESIRRSRPMTEAHQDDVRKMLAPGFKRDVFARIEQNLAGTSRWHPMGIGPDSARLLLRKLGPEHLDGAGKALGRLLAAGVEGASEAQVLAMLRGLALRGLGMYPVFQGLLDPLLEALAQRLAFAARGVFTLLRDCRVPRSHRVWDAATRTHNAATVGGLVPADFLDDALAEELVARCLRDPVHDYNTGTCQFLMSFHRFLPPVEASKVIIQYLYVCCIFRDGLRS
ncbi:hypothetical protein DIPPA_15370 [Diplonema papillatum]|nr:hypothetical protein DIPPA_15370 [Diplonema papillatum]